jgi:hypothetical protein
MSTAAEACVFPVVQRFHKIRQQLYRVVGSLHGKAQHIAKAKQHEIILRVVRFLFQKTSGALAEIPRGFEKQPNAFSHCLNPWVQLNL